MKESYDERVATYIGPESCAIVRKAAGEVLTGVRTGQPLSCEINVQNADAVKRSGRQHHG